MRKHEEFGADRPHPGWAILWSLLWLLVVAIAFVLFRGIEIDRGAHSLKSMAQWEKIAEETINSNGTFTVMSAPVDCAQCIQGLVRVSSTMYSGAHVRANSSVADMAVVLLSGEATPSQSPIVARQVAAPEGGPCCTLLLRGLRLRANEDVLINPANTQGVTPVHALSSFLSANDQVRSALGEAKTFIKRFVLVNDQMTANNNGRNEIFFAALTNVPESMNIVALSIVYFICTDYNAAAQQCVGELEMTAQKIIFNSAAFTFGDGKRRKTVMDLAAVANHELGHWQGIGDFSGDGCTEATMFGRVGAGETKKRTFHLTDRHCLQFLYGEVQSSSAPSMMIVWRGTTYLLFGILYFFLCG